MRVVSAFFLCLVASGVAAADKPSKRIVGILDVRGPTPESATAFAADLEKQITAKDYWVASRTKMRERLRNSTEWADGCVAGPCLSEVRVQTQAELVLLATLTGAGTEFGYVVTLVRTDTGTVFAQASERCDVCTQQEAQTAATLKVIELLNNVPATLPDPAGEAGAATDVAVGRLERQLEKAKQSPRRIGVGLTVVGLVAAGVGTLLYVANDRPTAMLATATLGAGMMASGVVVLTF